MPLTCRHTLLHRSSSNQCLPSRRQPMAQSIDTMAAQSQTSFLAPFWAQAALGAFSWPTTSTWATSAPSRLCPRHTLSKINRQAKHLNEGPCITGCSYELHKFWVVEGCVDHECVMIGAVTCLVLVWLLRYKHGISNHSSLCQAFVRWGGHATCTESQE